MALLIDPSGRLQNADRREGKRYITCLQARCKPEDSIQHHGPRRTPLLLGIACAGSISSRLSKTFQISRAKAIFVDIAWHSCGKSFD
jgi:hypothetical protein